MALGVEEELSRVGDGAHEGARVAGTGGGAERQVLGGRAEEDRVARRRPGEADEGALARDDAAGGGDQPGRDADAPPAVRRLGLVVQGGADLEVGGDPPAVVGLAGGKDVARQVGGFAFADGALALGRVVALVGGGIDEAGVGGQALALDDDRIDRGSDLGTDGLHEAIADYEGRFIEDLAGREDDARVSDGEDPGVQRIGTLGGDQGQTPREEEEGHEQHDSAHGSDPPA